MKGFRQFLLRGNVIDLAVAVVIGAAFGAVVAAFVKDLLTPLIAAIFGKPDFSAWTFEFNNSKFLIGDFLNALIAARVASALSSSSQSSRAAAKVGPINSRYRLTLAHVGLCVVGERISTIRFGASRQRISAAV